MIKENFEKNGFWIAHNLIAKNLISEIHQDLLKIGAALNPNKSFDDINEMWNYYRVNNRDTASSIYNGFKHLQSVKRLALSEQLELSLKRDFLIKFPTLVDINCRIDTKDEEKYLFDWHQDYWFSVCSVNAVVVWIPIVNLNPEIGGLEIIENSQTNGKIFSAKARTVNYNSYADAIILDEEINHFHSTSINSMTAGDALIFKFNLLHKSIPINSNNRSRFTIQLRFADFQDSEFISNKFKPGIVNKDSIEYLQRDKK